MKYMELRKLYIITIVGAESSGKTTLALQLASLFQGTHVTEYAREYLSLLDRGYNENDLQIIAEKEIERIYKAIKEQTVPEEEGQKYFYTDLLENQTGSVNELLIDLVPKDRTIIIIDGGMLTLRMWAKIKYDATLPLVEKVLQEDVTDLYILCKPRKQWEPDPLREAPEIIDRVWIYNQYLREIVRMKKEFRIVAV